MANGYQTGKQGPSFSGSYFKPQDVGFSESEGRSIKVASADPGVYEGVSTTAANGTSGSGKNFVSKNS